MGTKIAVNREIIGSVKRAADKLGSEQDLARQSGVNQSTLNMLSKCKGGEGNMSERKNVFDRAKVKSLLGENGLTAVEIARKAGISRSQMSTYMHGRRNPKRITVQRIADVLAGRTC